jgi:hypothetical protein
MMGITARAAVDVDLERVADLVFETLGINVSSVLIHLGLLLGLKPEDGDLDDTYAVDEE